jgi:ABC-2 type transport system permease protein
VNWHAILAIARKDMLIVRRSRAMLYPLVILPLLLLVLLPLSIALAAGNPGTASEIIRQFEPFIGQLPGGALDTIAGRDDDAERVILLGNVYFLAPLYLLVPLLVAAVVAADTFAGEKERKTLEALLYTPLSDRELLVGKLLAAWIPSVCVSLAGFLVYAVLINIAAWPVMGEIFFPNWMWLLLVFWVGPAVAGMGLGAMVLVSSRVGTLQEASQLGAGVILPVVLLVVGQAFGVIYFSASLVAVLGLAIWLLNGVLFLMAMRRFQRESLLRGS